MLEDPQTDKNTVAYIKEKLQKAKDLIEQISKRHSTIEKIINVVIERQKEYFDGKKTCPLPLSQKELSDKFGIHPSTTSRAIAEKYIETPLGVIQLKTLFPRETSGTTKNQIMIDVASIIRGEDTDKPLADKEIQKKLAEKGIISQRRTVSDYRKQSGIEDIYKRKKK